MSILKWMFFSILGLGILGLTAFLTFGPASIERGRNKVAAYDPYLVSTAARKRHDRLLWKRDLLERGTRGQGGIPRLQKGNVAIQFFTAVTKSPAGLNHQRNAADTPDNITLMALGQMWPPAIWQSIFERAIYQARKLHGFEACALNSLKIINPPADLETLLQSRAEGEKTIAALLEIEDTHTLKAGVCEIHIRKLMGENMLRVLRQRLI